MTVIRFDPFQELDRLTRQMAGSGRVSRQLFLGDNLDAGRLEAGFDQGSSAERSGGGAS
jgi:hypothetical protein